MSNFHIWSDFPNSFCKICGMPNLMEVAMRRFDYDIFINEWISERKKELYEELAISCPASSEDLELLLQFAYGLIDDSEIETM